MTPGVVETGSDAAEWVAWSPDGCKLAYTRIHGADDRTARRTLTICDLPSGQTLFEDTGGKCYGLAWTPDGKGVVFSRGEGGRARLCQVTPAASARIESITGADSGKYWLGASDGVWMGTNRLLFFRTTSSTSPTEFLCWDRRTRKVQSVWRSAERFICPETTRDGKLLAYLDASSFSRMLRVMSMPGMKPIYRGDGRTGSVLWMAWGPGSGELFYWAAGEKKDQLRRLNVFTGADRLIDSRYGFEGPISVSPRGDVAIGAYRKGANGSEQVIVFDGTSGRKICESPMGLDASQPCWSPDGKRLALFVRDTKRGNRITTVAYGAAGVASWRSGGALPRKGPATVAPARRGWRRGRGR